MRSPRALGAHDDAARFGRVVGGVLEQVAQRVVQLGGIADDGRGVGRDAMLDDLLARLERATRARFRRRRRAPSTGQGTRSSVSWPASSRARRSRSRTSRSIRSVWRPMISRKRRTSSAPRDRRRPIEQRLDVAAHGGERRAQLVRDVGDEVAADAIGAAQVGDVVHDEHGAARRRRARPARCAR